MNINLSTVEELVKKNRQQRGHTASFFKGITSTKIRRIMEPLNHLYSDVINNQSDILTDDQLFELEYLKIRMAYDAGRDKQGRDYPTKTFLEETKISDYVSQVIESKKKSDFIKLCRYFEAIIAYSKFHGMGDR